MSPAFRARGGGGAAGWPSLLGERLWLTEGSVYDLSCRAMGGFSDPIEYGAFVFDRRGRDALTGLWRDYLAVARDHRLPIVLQTPTWRGHPDRLAASRWRDRDPDGAAVRLVRNAVAEFTSMSSGPVPRVLVAGLIGPRGDCYSPDEAPDALTALVYHRPQAARLAAAGADALLAATLPALDEARGLARAMAATGRPYALSFVLRRDGTLLDGTPLESAVRAIDAEAEPRPSWYQANCVHPDAFAEALDAVRARDAAAAERVAGFQGNASPRPPWELRDAAEPEGDLPRRFAESVEACLRRHHCRLVGGCCGTNAGHIAAVAHLIA